MKKQVKDLVSGDIFQENRGGNVWTVQRITLREGGVEVEATSPTRMVPAHLFYDHTLEVEMWEEATLCQGCGMFHRADRKECPLNCGTCGGEKDGNGDCARYCRENAEVEEEVRREDANPSYLNSYIPKTAIVSSLPPPDDGWDIPVMEMKEEDRPTLRPTGDETLESQS